MNERYWPHASRGCHKSKIDGTKNQLLGFNFWTLYMIYMEFLKSFSEPILRYGNPDRRNLGTLNYKIWINTFLGFLSNNTGSDFISRGAICF